MAIIFMDGAERNSMSQWTTAQGSSLETASTYGMSGSYCFFIQDTNLHYLEKTLPTSYSELYFTSKIRYHDAGVSMMRFKDSAGTVMGYVRRNVTTNFIELYVGSSLVDTGAIPITTNVVYLIEVRYKPLDSGGEFTVKVDGVTDATFTGDTVPAGGLENIQTFRYGHDGVSGGGMTFDDVVVSDSGWLGNQYIQLIVPTGAGDSTQWDPSTGSNYACVDEASASDTDYVSTNVTDEVDLYALGNLTGTIGSVTAIHTCVRIAYDGTPTPTKQKIAIKSGSTEYYGSDVSPTLTFIDNFNLWELNPDGSTAWTESSVNALQAGVKSVA